MKEPIQNTSAEIKTTQITEKDEPFVSALKERKYEIVWMEQKKSHTFYCSDFRAGSRQCKIMMDVSTPKESVASGYYTSPAGEWIFYDVIMDTSKRDAEGRATLVRMTYHPQISLVNIPFMVLPAEGEKEEIHIPDDVNMLPPGD